MEDGINHAWSLEEIASLMGGSVKIAPQELRLKRGLGEPHDVATTKERLDGIDAHLKIIDGRFGKSSEVPKPSSTGSARTSFWPKTLSEWAQVIGVGLAVIVAVCSVTLYLGSLMVDRHVQSALKPVQDSVDQISGDVREIKGALAVLQVRIAAAQYSNVPEQQLKAHRDELKAINNTLARTDMATPDYWPVSFQVIKLLSMAASYIQNSKATHSTLDNMGGVHVVNNGDVVVLKHEISNSLIEDSVVQFDPTVRLMNVTFKNCVFIFPDSLLSPPKPLQEIAIALLDSDISNATISTS